MHGPELQKRLEEMSITPIGSQPEDLGRQLQEDFNKYAQFKQIR